MLLQALPVERDWFVSREGLVHLTAYNPKQHHVTPIHVGNDFWLLCPQLSPRCICFRPAVTTFSSYRFCDSTERLLDFCSIISILRISFIALDHQTKKSRQTRKFTDKICFKSFGISILSLYYLTHSRTSLKCCTSRRRKERYLPRTEACPLKWWQIRVLSGTPTSRPARTISIDYTYSVLLPKTNRQINIQNRHSISPSLVPTVLKNPAENPPVKAP